MPNLSRIRQEDRPQRRDAMVRYLRQHPRFFVLAPWNRATTYAFCTKYDDLGWSPQDVYNAKRFFSCEEAHRSSNLMLSLFSRRHRERWQIVRSQIDPVMLLLLPGSRDPASGQMQVSHTPIDDPLEPGTPFEDWRLDVIRQRVELVWDFDLTVATALETYLKYTYEHDLQTEQVKTVTTRYRAVPRRESVAV